MSRGPGPRSVPLRTFSDEKVVDSEVKTLYYPSPSVEKSGVARQVRSLAKLVRRIFY
jgi:hypothetical protein